MRNIAIVSALTLSLGAMAFSTAADARPRGHGYGHGGHGGYAYRGGGRRGIGTGAAVGLGIAGLAAGAIAADSYRRSTYDDGVVYGFADGSALAVTKGGWDTVAWDAVDGAFYSVEPWGARNVNGWRFPAA